MIAELSCFRVAIIVAHALDAFLSLWITNRRWVLTCSTGVFRAIAYIVLTGTPRTSTVGAIEAFHASCTSSAIGLVSPAHLRAASPCTIRPVTTVRCQRQADVYQVHNLAASSLCTSFPFTFWYADLLVGISRLHTAIAGTTQEVFIAGVAQSQRCYTVPRIQVTNLPVRTSCDAVHSTGKWCRDTSISCLLKIETLISGFTVISCDT